MTGLLKMLVQTEVGGEIRVTRLTARGECVRKTDVWCRMCVSLSLKRTPMKSARRQLLDGAAVREGLQSILFRTSATVIGGDPAAVSRPSPGDAGAVGGSQSS